MNNRHFIYTKLQQEKVELDNLNRQNYQSSAEVICVDKAMTLSEKPFINIPLGEVHQLSNSGAITSEIIEIQSGGGYLGEDDIVRFDDSYGLHNGNH